MQRWPLSRWSFPTKGEENFFEVLNAQFSYDWYMEKQHVIEEIFSDIVPRFKAAYLTVCQALVLLELKRRKRSKT